MRSFAIKLLVILAGCLLFQNSLAQTGTCAKLTTTNADCTYGSTPQYVTPCSHLLYQFWIYASPTTSSTPSTFLELSDVTGSNGDLISFACTSTGKIRVQMRSVRSGTVYTVTSSRVVCQAGKWHHFAVETTSAGVVTTWVDNVNDTTHTFPSLSSINYNAMSTLSRGSNPYVSLDELAIFCLSGAPLSVSNMVQVYSTLGYCLSSSNNPQAYWCFNEGTGTVSYEVSGDANRNDTGYGCDPKVNAWGTNSPIPNACKRCQLSIKTVTAAPASGGTYCANVTGIPEGATTSDIKVLYGTTYLTGITIQGSTKPAGGPRNGEWVTKICGHAPAVKAAVTIKIELYNQAALSATTTFTPATSSPSHTLGVSDTPSSTLTLTATPSNSLSASGTSGQSASTTPSAQPVGASSAFVLSSVAGPVAPSSQPPVQLSVSPAVALSSAPPAPVSLSSAASLAASSVAASSVAASSVAASSAAASSVAASSVAPVATSSAVPVQPSSPAASSELPVSSPDVPHCDNEDIPTSPADIKSTFDALIAEYGFQWNTTEYNYRLGVFETFLQNVLTLRSKYPDNCFGITQWWHLTEEEFNATVLMEPYSPTRDNTLPHLDNLNMTRPKHMAKVTEASARTSSEKTGGYSHVLDWRYHSGIVTSVKDQKSCGSCWAFTTTEVLESVYAITHKKKASVLSPQEVIDCSSHNNGCHGGFTDVAAKDIKAHGGLETQARYGPYYGAKETCHASKTGFRVIPKTAFYTCDSAVCSQNSMIKALRNGPISVYVFVTTKTVGKDEYVTGLWASYKGGYVDGAQLGCHKGQDINHAMSLVGYGFYKGHPVWALRNHWRTSWGQAGYMYIARGQNACEVEAWPIGLTVE